MTATTIKLKRSTTANSIPATTSLSAGELALNTYDGKLFFKKDVGGTESIVTLQPFPSGGAYGQVLALDSSNNPTWINTSASGLTIRNTLGNAGTVTKTVPSVTSINFDASTGLVVTTQDTGNVFVSLGQVGTATPIKTFNILGDFGLLPGTARFYPAAQDTIKSVVLSVGVNRSSDLTVGLYNSGSFLQFFTIPSGQNYAKYTDLNYVIYPGESYTVNVVAGNGTNLSMALYNINL
jgi:hypothetical protein